MRYLLTVVLLTIPTQAVDAQTLSESLKGEPVSQLAKAARERGNAVRGAILFPQQKLACANCHAAGREDLLGPDLSRLGKEVTDEKLVESVLYPSKTIRDGYGVLTVETKAGRILAGRVLFFNNERLVLRQNSAGYPRTTLAKEDVAQTKVTPISAMPDNLVDQLQTRQQFLDLIRYLIELRDAGPSAASGAGGGYTQKPIDERVKGLALIGQYGCAHCHESPAGATATKQSPDLSVTMSAIDPHFVRRYLENPHATKPGATMPDVLGVLKGEDRDQAIEELTHFVVSLAKQRFDRQPLDAESASRGEDLFHSVGCVACHSPRNADGDELLAKTSVPLGPLHAKYNLDGLVALLKDPLAGRPSGRMPDMNLTHWEATDVANYLLRGPGDVDDGKPAWRIDPGLVEKGRQRFSKLGCAACHTPDSERSSGLPSLDSLTLTRGCLSEATGRWPAFQLNPDQRTAISTALTSMSKEQSESQRIHVTLASFRCTSCHERDGVGGVTGERDVYFKTANENLGPQGRIPPTLTGVGAKLKPKWLRQVLVSGRAIRPYMKTRMPQFGTKNVGQLVDSLPAHDQLPEIAFAKFRNEKEIRKTGHELVGSSGLNCIACHTFQQKAGATMAAVDLTEMEERLEKRWFYHYMEAPQRLSRNTVMPTFWPGGRAIRKDILDGKSKEQIEAIWLYLRDGRQARTPRGLVTKPIELLAKSDEAVMLRRSYPGIGKRGIGVGYPRQLNIAFDAEQMRIGLMWQGKFADPGGVWRSQGHGTVRPLSRNVVRFAAGPDIDDAERPWKPDDGRPPQHRFRGYHLDDRQRPIFMYLVEGVEVEDAIVDMGEPGDAVLRRTITLNSKSKKRLRFRVASGRAIRETGGGFQVDQALHVRIKDGPPLQVVKANEQTTLNAVIELTPGISKVVVEYAWREELK